MPGDQPTLQERRRFAEGQMVPGRILYLWCPFIPKDKYIIIASVDDDACLSFMVNSTPSEYAQERAHLRACQLEITKEDYPFLDHRSFINCARALERIDEAEMIRQVTADTSRSKGMLASAQSAFISQRRKGHPLGA